MLIHFFHKLKNLFSVKNCTRFLIFLLPIIIVSVLIGPAIWGGKVFLDTAHSTAQYSIYFSLKSSLDSGVWFPVWIEQWASGFSLWLLPSSFGLLNPLHIILVKFLDFALAFNIFVFIYLVAGFYAAYFLGRALDLSKAASMIVALAYGFSGYSIWWGHVLPISFVYFLLPFLFLTLLKIYRGEQAGKFTTAPEGHALVVGEGSSAAGFRPLGQATRFGRFIKGLWACPRGYIFWSAIFIFLAWPFALTQIFLYSLVATLAFALYLDLAKRKPGSRSSEGSEAAKDESELSLPGKKGPILKRWPVVKGFFYFFIPGTFLALFWLIPIYNFLQLSVRAGGLALNVAGHGRLVWDPIFAYIYPSFYIPRIIRESFLYVGILPFALAVFALGNFKKDRMVRFFSIGYIFILAALVPDSPVWRLFNLTPVLNLFRVPLQLLFVGNFFLAVLAGFGLDGLSENKIIPSTKFFKNYFRGLKIVVFLYLVPFLVAALIMRFYRIALQNTIYNYFVEHLLKFTKHRPLEHYYTLINGYFDKFSWSVSFSNPYFLTMLFSLGAVYALFYFYRRGKFTFDNLKIIAVIITVADLLFVWRGHYSFMPRDWLDPAPAAVFLNSRDKGLFRIYVIYERYFDLEKMGYDASDSSDYKKDILRQRSRLLGYGLNGVSGVRGEISMLDPRRYLKIIEALTEPDVAAVVKPEDLSLADSIKAWQSLRNRNLLSMMNTKYIISSFNFSLPWKKIFEIKPIENENIMTYVYENTEVLPRVYFANNANIIKPDEIKAFDALLAINNFKKTTLIECESCANSGRPNTKDSLEIIKSSPGHIIIKTQTKNSRYLVYSESNVPYWEARVDGKASPILMANYMYQAVLVLPGEHLIEFQYPGPITQFKYSLKNLFKIFTKTR